jgi:hypothetical protein
MQDLELRWSEVLRSKYYGFLPDLVDESVANLVVVYKNFLESGCADSTFEEQIRLPRHYSERLGEMLMYDRLKCAGFELSSKDNGPDFRAERNNQMLCMGHWSSGDFLLIFPYSVLEGNSLNHFGQACGSS